MLHIYRAFYGLINEQYTAQCKSPNGQQPDSGPPKSSSHLDDEDDECQVTNETDMLIELCQGYRKCNLMVADETFLRNQTDAVYQSNCKQRKRLKVHYTCTNGKILTDDYQNRQQQVPSELHEQSSTLSTASFDDGLPPSEDQSSSAEVSTEQAAPSVPNHFEILPPITARPSREEGANLDENQKNPNCTEPIGFVSEWLQALYYMSGNLERLFLYFLVSILFALLCIVLVLSCKLRKDKNRAKKCIKQQQPIFEYIPDEEDEENLMSPVNSPQHYKQMQRQLLNNALIANRETNNNTIQSSRNGRTMVLLSGAPGSSTGVGHAYYSALPQSALRSSPTSQINPNYIHPFLNESELINRDEDDEDEPLEGGFISSPDEQLPTTDRQNLMVSATPIRSSFKTTTQLTRPSSQRPILIKDHASTIHFIRSSSYKPATCLQTNRIALSSSTLSALLSGARPTGGNRFNTLPSFEPADEERRPMLSSSPNIHPLHLLTSSFTSSGSANTTLTTATASFSKADSSKGGSPRDGSSKAGSSQASSKNTSPVSQSFSQRTTPASKTRLIDASQTPKFVALTTSLNKSNAIVTTSMPINAVKCDFASSPVHSPPFPSPPILSPLKSPISPTSPSQMSPSQISPIRSSAHSSPHNSGRDSAHSSPHSSLHSSLASKASSLRSSTASPGQSNEEKLQLINQNDSLDSNSPLNLERPDEFDDRKGEGTVKEIANKIERDIKERDIKDLPDNLNDMKDNQSDNMKDNQTDKTKSRQTDVKQPAWLDQPSPRKHKPIARLSFDEAHSVRSQTISSVGENLFK